jgi:enoyl-CoA hydratase/carnithine racemase
MSSPTVLLTTDGAVATLTLNRPDKLNALDYETNDLLLDLLDGIERDDRVRAVILTGTGRAFSAGGDIPEFAATIRSCPGRAARDFVRRGQLLTARIENFPKPVIAAVNGLAYGGGCEVTEAAHLALATPEARFAKPEVAIGIPPTFGGTQRLPRLAGRKRALELLLTGDSISARRAMDIGLINRIAPADVLLEQARALAHAIVRHSRDAITGILAAVTRGQDLTLAEGLRIEADQFELVAGRPDCLAHLDRWIARRD